MSEKRNTILVVDDTSENIDLLVATLADHYQVKAAINGQIALKLVEMAPPDLILLDIMMPGLDGFEVCQRLKANPATRQIPVIFITAMSEGTDELKGLTLGAVDYITKPISPPIVLARVKTHLALTNQQQQLELLVRQRTAELEQTRLQIVQRLGRAAEYKDNETGLHVIRMSHYAYALAKAAGMSEADSLMMMHAAPMHDIGKIGIPDHILKKPGRLTEDELVIMRRHCEIGAEIIGGTESALMELAKEIALTHHEKWDGSGYPYGLATTAIPLSGRIIAIADVFDALTTQRPYKKAWTVDQAVAYIREQAGKHFDPKLVELFLQHLDSMIAIQQQYAETDAAAQL